MDIFLSVVAGILMLVGIVGCLLPVIPGPPLSYIGLLLMQLKTDPPFETDFMILWAVIAVGVTVLDYVIPAYGTKKYGGSRAGVIGTFVGLVAGFFFPIQIIGIILGPFVGAFVGELIVGKNSKESFRAAMGSFIGFLFGTLIKLVACCIMTFFYVSSLF